MTRMENVLSLQHLPAIGLGSLASDTCSVDQDSNDAGDVMRSWVRSRLLLVLFMLLVTTTAQAASNKIEAGRALYLSYCASCHGLTGEGDGPIARALMTPPANLRRLSERFGNPLPEDQVARYIDGRSEVKAHGPRDMPVWGTRFYYQTGGDEHRVKQMIGELVAFLQSIQSSLHQSLLGDRRTP